MQSATIFGRSVSPVGRALGSLGVAVVLVATLLSSAVTGPAAAASDSNETFLPAPQINGVVWDTAMRGNVVYAAGEFTKARPYGAAPGQQEVARSNLLAFDVTTGKLLEGTPAVNGPVRVLELSPDRSRLYLGGRFGTVGGSTRNNLAALDTTSRALTSWAPGTDGEVTALSATTSTVYVGGFFTHAQGQTRNRLAAFATDGRMLGWAPSADDGVKALLARPDGSRVFVGGMFSSVNGSSRPGRGLTLVDGRSGAVLPTPANDRIRTAHNGAITSFSTDGTTVYASAFQYGPVEPGVDPFEGTVAMDWNGTVRWLNACMGDSYDTIPLGGYLYVASHAHGCDSIGGFPEEQPRIYHRAMAFTLTARSEYNRRSFRSYRHSTQTDFLPPFGIGTYTGMSQGPWTVTGDDRFVVYGGEFTSIGSRQQQGLAVIKIRALREMFTPLPPKPPTTQPPTTKPPAPASRLEVRAVRAPRHHGTRRWKWRVTVHNRTRHPVRVRLEWRAVRSHRRMVKVIRVMPGRSHRTILRRAWTRPTATAAGRAVVWRTVRWKSPALRP